MKKYTVNIGTAIRSLNLSNTMSFKEAFLFNDEYALSYLNEQIKLALEKEIETSHKEYLDADERYNVIDKIYEKGGWYHMDDDYPFFDEDQKARYKAIIEELDDASISLQYAERGYKATTNRIRGVLNNYDNVEYIIHKESFESSQEFKSVIYYTSKGHIFKYYLDSVWNNDGAHDIGDQIDFDDVIRRAEMYK